MNDYGVADDDRRMVVDDDLVTSDARPSELDRWGLLAALAGGAAGLLLPRLVEARRLRGRDGLQGLLGIRFEIVNTDWPSKDPSVIVGFWVWDDSRHQWARQGTRSLARGDSASFETGRTRAQLRFDDAWANRYEVEASNGLIGAPWVRTFLNGVRRVNKQLDPGQEVKWSWAKQGGPTVWIKRRRDSARYKEYSVVLGHT